MPQGAKQRPYDNTEKIPTDICPPVSKRFGKSGKEKLPVTAGNLLQSQAVGQPSAMTGCGLEEDDRTKTPCEREPEMNHN